MKKEYIKPVTTLVRVNIDSAILVSASQISNGGSSETIEPDEGGDWAE